MPRRRPIRGRRVRELLVAATDELVEVVERAERLEIVEGPGDHEPMHPATAVTTSAAQPVGLTKRKLALPVASTSPICGPSASR